MADPIVAGAELGRLLDLSEPVLLVVDDVWEESQLQVPSEQQWDVERFLGFLRSTSSRPDQRLGDRFPGFADEIRKAVESVEPSGRWSLRSTVEVILSRR